MKVESGIKAVYLGYMNKMLPDGREINLDKLEYFSYFDGFGVYDKQTKTIYLVS